MDTLLCCREIGLLPLCSQKFESSSIVAAQPNLAVRLRLLLLASVVCQMSCSDFQLRPGPGTHHRLLHGGVLLLAVRLEANREPAQVARARPEGEKDSSLEKLLLCENTFQRNWSKALTVIVLAISCFPGKKHFCEQDKKIIVQG